jgi:hypothetical protein
MNGQRQAQGITRRSFIKRSVVAAVAVSNLAVLSGLVNAADDGSEYKDIPRRKDPYSSCRVQNPFDTELNVHRCFYVNVDINCGKTAICGDQLDDLGEQEVNCQIHKSWETAQFCNSFYVYG